MRIPGTNLRITRGRRRDRRTANYATAVLSVLVAGVLMWMFLPDILDGDRSGLPIVITMLFLAACSGFTAVQEFRRDWAVRRRAQRQRVVLRG